VGVAKDDRAVGEDEVDVAIAVDVPDVGALAALGERWVLAIDEPVAGEDAALEGEGGVDLGTAGEQRL
jgi:hypothetical protein